MIASLVLALVLRAPVAKPVVAFLPTVTTSMETPPGTTPKEIDALNSVWPWLRSAGATFTTPDVLKFASAMKAAGLPSDQGATVQPEGFGYNLVKAGKAARAVGADYLVATWVFKVKRGKPGPYDWMSLSGAFTMVDLRGPKDVSLCVLKPASVFVNKPANAALDVRNVIRTWADSVHTMVGIEITKANKKKP